MKRAMKTLVAALAALALALPGVAFSDLVWSLLPDGAIGSGLTGCPMICDPVGDRYVLYGGELIPIESSEAVNVWALGQPPDAGWQRLSQSFVPYYSRVHASATYDPVAHRMLVFGGIGTHNGAIPTNRLFSFDLGSSSWVEILPGGLLPAPRESHSAIYDSNRHRLIVYGGFTSADPNEVWKLDLNGTPTWSLLEPSGTPPPSRMGHVAVYDEIRNRMLVFSGNTGLGTLSDVWSLTLDEDPTWSEILPTGTTPPPRWQGGGVFDLAYDRLVVFGGADGSVQRNDTWELRFSGPELTWRQLPSGPSGRSGFGCAHDLANHEMVVAHGTGGGETTWALSLDGNPRWYEIFRGTPGRAVNHSAIFDTPRDRMVVFGAEAGGAWALPMGATRWSRLATTGTPPSERTRHTAIYDPGRERMIVFGGGTGTNDLWSLSLSGVPTWSPLTASGTPPEPRNRHTAVYDSDRDRMIVFGGRGAAGTLNDTWELSLSGTSPV